MVFPFDHILPVIVMNTIYSLLSPLFWVVVAVVALQYRRLAAVRESFLGPVPGGIWSEVALAVGVGVLGGLVGSVVLVFIGLTLTEVGLVYLWPLALLLMLINVRFLCFAYAGGLLAVSNVLFGVPQLNVPQVLSLVAVLHMVESFLIMISGHAGAVPAFFRNREGRVVGGFVLQKFWPIPIVALVVAGQAPPDEAVIQMPDWWPLLKPGIDAGRDELIYVLVPLVAGLGYGDLVLTRTPREKSYVSSLHLALYSMILLVLALLADRSRLLALLAAAFSTLGHEAVVRIGRNLEMKGHPLYVSRPGGLLILDVAPGTPAWGAGLRSGDMLVSVNGLPVRDRPSLETALGLGFYPVELAFLSGSERRYRRELIFLRGEPLGLLPVPEGDEENCMEVDTAGPLGRWLRNFRRRLRDR